MKQSCFFLFAIFFYQPGFAQQSVDELATDSARMYIAYADYSGFVDDSTFASVRHASLFLGNKASVYVDQIRTPEYMQQRMKESMVVTKGRIDTAAIWNNLNSYYDLEKRGFLIYARYYGSPTYLQLKQVEKADLWVADTSGIQWKLMNEFKIVHGYRCQRASSTTTKGAEMTAWFTEEIPFSVGPVYLSGLPGAILEYYNAGKARLIRATAISSESIPEERFRKWMTGPVISKAEFSSLIKAGSKKMREFLRMTGIAQD